MTEVELSFKYTIVALKSNDKGLVSATSFACLVEDTESYKYIRTLKFICICGVGIENTLGFSEGFQVQIRGV